MSVEVPALNICFPKIKILVCSGTNMVSLYMVSNVGRLQGKSVASIWGEVNCVSSCTSCLHNPSTGNYSKTFNLKFMERNHKNIWMSITEMHVWCKPKLMEFSQCLIALILAQNICCVHRGTLFHSQFDSQETNIAISYYKTNFFTLSVSSNNTRWFLSM